MFAKISQTEAAGHEGTEIAVNVVVEGKETNSFSVSHHHQLAIKDVLAVSFEMDRGERFSIISPAGVRMSFSVLILSYSLGGWLHLIQVL